jgi:hypothetical protein
MVGRGASPPHRRETRVPVAPVFVARHESALKPLAASVRHDPGVDSKPDAAGERERELLWRAADRASTWALQGQASV